MTKSTLAPFLEADLLARAAATKALFASAPRSRHTSVLKGLIDDADLVIGVYFGQGGLTTAVIKGEGLLEVIAHTNQSRTVTTRVIPVGELAEAMAMRQVLGDGARLQ